MARDCLHFAPVPANRTVTSLDTFTILVDRSVEFDSRICNGLSGDRCECRPQSHGTWASLVILDGSGSTNPERFGTVDVQLEDQSTPIRVLRRSLYWYDTVRPQFPVDLPGNYVIRLTVSNGAAATPRWSR